MSGLDAEAAKQQPFIGSMGIYVFRKEVSKPPSRCKQKPRQLFNCSEHYCWCWLVVLGARHYEQGTAGIEAGHETLGRCSV